MSGRIEPLNDGDVEVARILSENLRDSVPVYETTEPRTDTSLNRRAAFKRLIERQGGKAEASSRRVETVDKRPLLITPLDGDVSRRARHVFARIARVVRATRSGIGRSLRFAGA